MNPNEPLQPQQPAPAPTPTAPPQPVAPQPQPAAVPQPQPTVTPPQPTPTPPAPAPAPFQKTRNTKKIILIVLAAIGGIIILAATALFVIGMLGGGVPKYSEEKQIELVGYEDTDENSGMKFAYPAQMKEKVKTDLSASLYQYYDDEDESKGILGALGADIQTISYIADVTQSEKDAFADVFNQSEFDEGFAESFESDDNVKNVKLSNKKSENSNGKFSADITLEIKSSDDTYESGKGVLLVFLEGRRLYTYSYIFTDQVYEKNQEFLENLLDGIEVGI